MKRLKSGMTVDTKAAEISGLHLKRTREHESWIEWWGLGRQEVHSREGFKFKVAMGVFWSCKFTWERARIKVSVGWPKSQWKKRWKTSISNTRKLQSKTWEWERLEWRRGRKGGDESETTFISAPLSYLQWMLEFKKRCPECEQKKTKVLWLNRFNCICCPFWASMSLWTAGHWVLTSYLPFFPIMPGFSVICP